MQIEKQKKKKWGQFFSLSVAFCFKINDCPVISVWDKG